MGEEDGGYSVVAHEGQHRVRGGIRAAEKASEGMTDRNINTHTHTTIRALYVNK